MQGLALTTTEVVARMAAALLCGAVIGLNRDLHRKPAGLRTFGLMSLGTAGLTVALARYGDPSTIGRAVQGMITGIGFLGAGMIVRPNRDNGAVHGLTTAAAVWLAAALAILCGLGLLALAGSVLLIALALLSFGQPVERVVEQFFNRRDERRRSRDAGGARPGS